jgi:hypothetical protein
LVAKHTVKKEQLEDFSTPWGTGSSQETTDWGSRLLSLKGREVLKTIETTLGTYPWKNPHTGQLTVINYLI